MAPRISFAGFKDPARRPRYIIWALVAVLVIAGVMVPVLGITSTRWFCAEGCHKVQDDTITAYEHSPHNQISCMACHMPVNADPVTFLLHKAEALGELALTVTNNYELPLNGESELALTMKSTQCTQCHELGKRPVTPSPGIVINHEVHAENEVTCAICHNRTAHVEDFRLTLIDPATGDPNRKHEDFMSMTACFRCHSQEKGDESPPGTCAACHTPKFKLKPASHDAKDFFPKGHAVLASAEESRVALHGGTPWLSAEETSAAAEAAGETETATEGEAGREAEAAGEGIGPSLPKVETINECSTCHTRAFCTDCHGVPMPHPPTFTKTHGAVGKADPKVCSKCHGSAATFCNDCHHGSALDWKYSTKQPWQQQHPAAVKQLGASACFDCHDPTYCANCHVNGSSN